MQKITPFLWFEDKAEEAANFYVSIFTDGKIGNISRYDKASAQVSGRPEGSAMVVEFELFGQKFTALNGGPQFKFSEAISFLISCDNQKEIDDYWNKLTADGGQEGQCGWLKDKYGVSWQIVPKQLNELIAGPDKEKSEQAMQKMLKMKKIVIADLENI